MSESEADYRSCNRCDNQGRYLVSYTDGKPAGWLCGDCLDELREYALPDKKCSRCGDAIGMGDSAITHMAAYDVLCSDCFEVVL